MEAVAITRVREWTLSRKQSLVEGIGLELNETSNMELFGKPP